MLGIYGGRRAKLGNGKSEVKRSNRLNCRKLGGIIEKQPLQSLICPIYNMKLRLALLATMSVVVVLNACSDPTSVKANAVTFVDTLSLFALSGTPPSYPSGLAVLARSPVRVDGFALFDVAFDIDAAGKAVVYPVRLVVASPSGSRAVGLIKLPAVFDAVTEAPKTGYQTDSSYVLNPGETLVIQTPHNLQQGDLCTFAINPYIYGKVTVDSISVASRTLFLRLGLDPNCGFRSFATGIPTS